MHRLQTIVNISLLIAGVIFLITLLLTMVGLGGGLVFSPLFVILGMAKSEAASASLLLNLVGAASAAYAYSRKKMVDFTLALPLIVSSGLTAPLGAYVNRQIDITFFLSVMSLVLVLAGVRMLVLPSIKEDVADISSLRRIGGSFGIGGCIGFLGGLLGIGGGVFVVPFLIFILRVPARMAAASSTFIVCFSSLTGFLGYASTGQINWGFVLPAAVASLIGGLVGARIMSSHLKSKHISRLFSIILFFLAARLLYQTFGGG